MPNQNFEQVPIRPAATIMFIDDRPTLEVLMVRRTATMVFAGGMWVFPGGRVDLEDYEHQAAAQEYEELPDPPAQAQAFCVAAIREAFEEAGILLACPLDGSQLPDLNADQMQADSLAHHRQALNAGNLSFLELLRQYQWRPAIDQLHYIGRWITPVGSPKRFDTRFFVARMPDGQTPAHDNNETTNNAWLDPTSALQQHEQGEFKMMTPTVAMLAVLAGFRQSSDLWLALGQATDTIRIRIQPQTGNLIFPDHPGYKEASTTIEFGWLKIRPQHQVRATAGPFAPSGEGVKTVRQ